MFSGKLFEEIVFKSKIDDWWLKIDPNHKEFDLFHIKTIKKTDRE